MHFKSGFLSRGLYLIISLCLILSGCLHTEEQQPKPSAPKSKLPQPKQPQAQEIISNLKETSLNKAHPRLMATDDDFKRIKKNLKTDENLKRWYKSLRTETNKVLQEPTVKYELSDGVRLLPVSRLVLKRTINLAMMYRLTGDEKYADRAWKELKTVADNKQFPNWNPKHFLDTAEMTNAVAIGYDWLYDYLSMEQREMLRKALVEKGLQPALQVYKGTANASEITTSWKSTTDNWNTVSNAGIAMGALAIGDESPEIEALSGEILQYAMKSIKKSLDVYAKDGGMPEGPSYWRYATSYIAYFLSSLDSALGTDYGLSKTEGLAKAGYYPIYTGGAKESFNIGDTGSDIISTAPQMFWFSNIYKNLDFYYFALKGNNPMNLIWYRKKEIKNSIIDKLPLDGFFQDDKTGIITMRSKWNSNAIFVGMHAGDNQANHSDLDIGDFVLDALGVRWAYELGADDYNLPGYFDMSSSRWNYYRKRAEGQNTLVVNPSNEPDQNIKAKAKILDVGSIPQQAFTVIDMTSAYEGDALSVKRGIALTDKRTTVVLQDELKLKEYSEVYWFMHTKSKIQISKDKKTATLLLSGKRMYAHILSPAEGQFSVMAAEPLFNSYNLLNQNYNTGIRKLTIHLDRVKNTTLSVVFTTDNEKGREIKYGARPLSLNKWDGWGVLTD